MSYAQITLHAIGYLADFRTCAKRGGLLTNIFRYLCRYIYLITGFRLPLSETLPGFVVERQVVVVSAVLNGDGDVASLTLSGTGGAITSNSSQGQTPQAGADKFSTVASS